MIKTRIGILIVLTGCLLSSGCQIIPWMEAVFAKDQEVPAEFEIPKDATVLVYVTDRHLADIADSVRMKRELTHAINVQLLHHELVTEVVAYEDLQALIASDPNFHSLTPGEIAAKLGANMVLSVRMDEFSLRDNEFDTLWSGKLKTRVRLTNSDDDLVWPKDRPLGLSMPMVDEVTHRETTETYGIKLTDMMAAESADDIGKLFREYKIKMNIHDREAPDMRW
jgi:hypothetical protein